MSNLSLLAPVNITRIMKWSQDIQTLPQPLLWYNRAAKPNVTDDELTLKQRSYIFAADIISTDSTALIRDAGEMKFERHEKTKLKHGHAINEQMIKLWRRIEMGRAMDNELQGFSNYITQRSQELRLGIEQRYEAMINGLLADSFTYNRLGIIASGTFGMLADLKFVAETPHTSTSSTPLADVVEALNYAVDTYGEQYNRITCEYAWVQAVIATTEFKNIFKTLRANGQLTLPTEHMNVISGVPLSFVPFLSAYFSETLGWEITVEVSRAKYREFSPSSLKAPVSFHAEGLLYFTNSGDDGQSSGWDLGKGEVTEAIVGSMGGSAIMGSFDGLGSFYGPVAYATPANPYLNPPGLTVWAADEGAPRKLRDTCSARFKWN